IMSGKMLYEWLARKRGEPSATEAARYIDAAMERVIGDAGALTRDLGGTASTAQMGDAVAMAIDRV
ncbi:MAG TPA: isocitrate/isopropylmalate dehydrogenase family protein, partial [Burkholderiales bacterium]|nr:isocitrate/isopropylmalate dehydrogenase family protein [Burkholderiales bacterium]